MSCQRSAELYEKFFGGYTRKQWGLDPIRVDKSVTARVPTRTNRGRSLFHSTVIQLMPMHGYTRMFERMLDHPNIKIMMQTRISEIRDVVPTAPDLHRPDRRVSSTSASASFPIASSRFKHVTLRPGTVPGRSASSTIRRPSNTPGSPSTST